MAHPDHAERIRAYADTVLMGSGLEDTNQIERLVERSSKWFGLDAQQAEQVRATAGKWSRHEPLDVSDIGCFEAIILPGQRPVGDIAGGKLLGLPPGEFYDLYGDVETRARIEACLPAIGRIDLPDSPSIPYAGTGFVVGHELLMTNRHVAQIFAGGVGRRGLAFYPGQSAAFDPRRERADEAFAAPHAISEVVMIHPYWDMALLRVPGLAATPLELVSEEVEGARRVVVVGYPAFDPRNDVGLQQQVFGGRFNLKRLAPGYFGDHRRVESFGRRVRAALHDSSTLGGNSGSAVLDVRTGQVVGLHFGGIYLDHNFAVPAAELSWDSRIIDAGVKFAGAPRPRKLPSEWSAAWNDVEETWPAAGRRSTVVPVTGGAASVTVTLPLEITLRFGRPAPVAVTEPEGEGHES